MKKVIMNSGLLLLAVTLMACAPRTVSEPTVLPPKNETSVSAEDTSVTLRFSQGTLIHGEEQGCYLTLPSHSNEGSLIYYADYQTQQLVELCTQPNCAHDNTSCTAWISCPANVPYITVADERLVLIYPGNPYFFDKYGEDVLPKIETRDLAGHFLKEVIKFTSGVTLANEYAVSNNDLYILEKDVSTGTLNITKTLVKVDLSSGKKMPVASFQPENNEDYFWIGTTKNEFVFKKISALENSSENAQKIRLSQVHQLFTVDSQGDCGAVFKEWEHLEGLEGFVDNEIFYITHGELSSFINEQGIKDAKLIQNHIFEPIEVNFIAYSEPYLIISSSVHRNENFDAPIFYSVNTQTREVKELSVITELGDDSNLSFYAQTDKMFFVLYYDQKANQETFALINKTDLWENHSAWSKFSFN